MTARIGYALALAAAAGAPIRVADQLMDRLAVPAQDDLAGQFTRGRAAAPASPPLAAAAPARQVQRADDELKQETPAGAMRHLVTALPAAALHPPTRGPEQLIFHDHEGFLVCAD